MSLLEKTPDPLLEESFRKQKEGIDPIQMVNLYSLRFTLHSWGKTAQVICYVSCQYVSLAQKSLDRVCNVR